MKTIEDLAPQLRKALAFDKTHPYTLEDVREELETAEAQVWLRGESCVITQVLENDGHTTLGYWLCAGKLDEVLALQDEIEAWAREQGCTLAIMSGRRGWARVLPEYGWEIDPTVNFTKRLA